MQLSGTVLRAIEEILREAKSKPADAAMRLVLRSGGLNPEQKRLISSAVFTYYRWHGWLKHSQALRGQLEHAFDLAATFQSNPSSISDEELLAKAVPPWVKDRMELSPALLRHFQAEPRLWLRARPGHANELIRKLGDSEAHAKVPDAIWYSGATDLFRTSEFHSGEFEIQDLSSQLVSHFCAPEPGETWWDACAGEGGKTLHLCDLMQNKGLVWASDPAQWRLDILKRRAARAKLFNYRPKPWTGKEALPTKTKFDGVLVDAPCSGIGTWQRNPHARWTTTPEQIANLATVQRDILNRVAGSLKPGGKLIYSVCTLTFAETTQLADQFEAEHPEFNRAPLAIPGEAGQTRVFVRPEQWQCAGMFIAAWTGRK